MLIAIRYEGNTVICTTRDLEGSSKLMPFDAAVDYFHGRTHVTIEPLCTVQLKSTPQGTAVALGNLPFSRLHVPVSAITLVEFEEALATGIEDTIRQRETGIVTPPSSGIQLATA